jgi:hypothetical protein
MRWFADRADDERFVSKRRSRVVWRLDAGAKLAGRFLRARWTSGIPCAL